MTDRTQLRDCLALEHVRLNRGRGRLVRIIARRSGTVVRTYDEEDLDRLIERARDYERTDPYSQHLPTDDAIAAAIEDDLI